METRNDNFFRPKDLPEDAWEEIAQNPSTIIKLSNSFNYLHTVFSKTMEFQFTSKLQLASECLRQLLNHAALGEWEAAESIWVLFPDLLTCRGTIYFPNRIYVEGQLPIDIPFDKNPGRSKYVECTAWQIALMNEEYEEAERIGQYMTEEEKQKQFDEIFPDGQIVKYDWDLADGQIVRCIWNLEKAKKLLQVVFDEIKKDADIDDENDMEKMSESTRNALLDLRSHAKPREEHAIGLLFDANFYLEALKLYDKKWRQLNWKQRTFWCICVEEWLAGCLGTGYLRANAQGIMRLAEENRSASREGCVLSRKDNSSYFGFRRTFDSLPGFHFFIGNYGGIFKSASYREEKIRAGFVETYIKEKRRQEQTLFNKMKSTQESSYFGFFNKKSTLVAIASVASITVLGAAAAAALVMNR